MARGGKRLGSGRKPASDRVQVMIRLSPDLNAKIEKLRNGKSKTATIERLLMAATERWLDEDANSALGFVLAQAANAADWQDRTWRDDPSTALALKLAVPGIIDMLSQTPEVTGHGYEHPLYKSAEEHARQVFLWVFNRLREKGDEYGSDWPAGHPLRNFPRAAADLNFSHTEKQKGGGK